MVRQAGTGRQIERDDRGDGLEHLVKIVGVDRRKGLLAHDFSFDAIQVGQYPNYQGQLLFFNRITDFNVVGDLHAGRAIAA